MAVRTKRGWLFLDFYCYAPNGKKIRCRDSLGFRDTKKGRKIAEAKDKAIKYELKHGKFDYLHFFPHGSKAHLFRKPIGNILFSDWWEQWISEKALRRNTERNWNSAYRVHLEPHFGAQPLGRIDEHEILVFRKHLEHNGMKANSINDQIIKPLRMCLLRAYRRGLISHYPCKDIRKLKEQRPDVDPFSIEELKALLAFLGNKKLEYYDMVFLWSRTGLRPGELYALKWKHIDYFNRKLMVRETMLTGGLEGPPKTESSIRDVDLRPPVMEALKRQEARTGLMDSYVFMTEAKKPFSDAFMRKKFRHLLRLAKLKHRPPKQMRHTFATLHIAAGENISWVSKMLGHASVETTLKKYNRFIPNLTHEDGSLLEKLMESESENRHHKGTSLAK